MMMMIPPMIKGSGSGSSTPPSSRSSKKIACSPAPPASSETRVRVKCFYVGRNRFVRITYNYGEAGIRMMMATGDFLRAVYYWKSILRFCAKECSTDRSKFAKCQPVRALRGSRDATVVIHRQIGSRAAAAAPRQSVRVLIGQIPANGTTTVIEASDPIRQQPARALIESDV